MPFPNFLIIGAPKAGTTSLYHYLRQHPQIFMSSIKEPNFFAYGECELLTFHGLEAQTMQQRIISNATRYQSLYNGVIDEIAVGEASMSNFLPRACQRIHHYLPNAKLIAILRQPAERAYSQFVYARQIGWEPLANFAQALAEEEKRIQQQWPLILCYKYFGYYHTRLTPYFEHYRRDQIRIYRYEQWTTKPLTVLVDMFGFLGVEDSFVPDLSIRHNVSQWPRSRLLVRWLKRPHWLMAVLKPLIPSSLRQQIRQTLAKRNMTQPPPLATNIHHRLTATYGDDIRQLQSFWRRIFPIGCKLLTVFETQANISSCRAYCIFVIPNISDPSMAKHSTTQKTGKQHQPKQKSNPSQTDSYEEYDSPWKEIIERFFPHFMHFFFPTIATLIDWSRQAEFLDKELQRIAPRSKTGRQTVDKLVKVWLLNGEETWFLIHIEVQSQKDILHKGIDDNKVTFSKV